MQSHENTCTCTCMILNLPVFFLKKKYRNKCISANDTDKMQYYEQLFQELKFKTFFQQPKIQNYFQ